MFPGGGSGLLASGRQLCLWFSVDFSVRFPCVQTLALPALSGPPFLSLFIPVLFPFPPLAGSKVPEFKIQMRFAREMGHFDGISEYRACPELFSTFSFLRVEYCVIELV